MGTRIEAIATVNGGLRRRHSALRLADAAARSCLAEAHVRPGAVDILVNAGIYRDRNLGEPALAALIQEDIGANPGDPPIGGHGTFSFDVANGGCGVLTALQLVDGLLEVGTAAQALIVASDAHPGRGTTADFPFGATGAAALCSWDRHVEGFGGFRWKTFPDFEDQYVADVHFDGSRNVLEIREKAEFRAQAAGAAANIAQALLEEQHMAIGDVDKVVATPLSPDFVDRLAVALMIPPERIVRPLRNRAHTAAPLFALDSVLRDASARDVHTVLLVAAGAGVTVGSAIYRR
jgi:3-oxoacyl-[acyl-carrier-protein] synthase-3